MERAGHLEGSYGPGGGSGGPGGGSGGPGGGSTASSTTASCPCKEGLGRFGKVWEGLRSFINALLGRFRKVWDPQDWTLLLG